MESKVNDLQKDRDRKYYLTEKSNGERCADNGELAKALIHFRNAYETEHGKKDKEMVIDMAGILAELGEPRAVWDFCQELLKAEETRGYAYYVLGASNQNAGNFAEAIEYYLKGLELPEGEASFLIEPHLLIGKCYSKLHQFEKGIAYLEKAVEIDPNNASVHHDLGECYVFAEQHLKAYRHLKQASKLNPKAATLGYLGIACRKLKQIPEAVNYLEKAIRLNKHLADLYVALGDLYKHDQEDYEKAVEVYSQGIENNPEESELYLLRFAAASLLSHQYFEKGLNPDEHLPFDLEEIRDALITAARYDDRIKVFEINNTPLRGIMVDGETLTIWRTDDGDMSEFMQLP